MFLLKFLLAAFIFFTGGSAQSQCGPPQCYDGCTDARPQVDIVFIVDVSGSMQPRIDGVKRGLTNFAQSLDSNQIDPRFAIVQYGRATCSSWSCTHYPTERVLPLSTFGPFRQAMDGLTIFGGWEPGLEALSNSMGVASAGNLNLGYRTGQNTKKVYILVTDEDSDKAIRSPNLFSGGGHTQAGVNNDGSCLPPGSGLSWDAWNGAWQPEIDFVANHLISLDASLYMFVPGQKTLAFGGIQPGQMCLTNYQYCNPEVQVHASDFSNFNAAQTLQNLNSHSNGGSLQGRLLTAGKIARCFDVMDTHDNNLVSNFFTQIVADVSACQNCLDYKCLNGQCQAPTQACDCAGVRFDQGGNKVTDRNGACCLPSQIDCAGLCNGGHNYDLCGVCTVGGALYSRCLLDCNNNRYLDLPPNPTSVSSYANLVYKSTCPNLPGYLLPNQDLITFYQSTQTTQSLCDHFHKFGRFEGRVQCTFDKAHYAQQHGVSQSNAEADWLASLLTASPKSARCLPGSRVKTPPLSKDQCDQCVINLDTPPFCQKDCSNTFRTSQSDMHFTDNCGHCVPPGTDPDDRKDDCGVCDGDNALKNECGECGGVRGNDPCGQPRCENEPCDIECDGVPRNPPEKHQDECGNCVEIVDVRADSCQQDCANTWYNNDSPTSSPHLVDECGICVPRSQERSAGCVQDCADTWYNNTSPTSSPHVVDECDICVPRSQGRSATCMQDCNGNWYNSATHQPQYKVDDCGECNPVADFNKLKDNCGVCTNQQGYNSTTDCTPDCKGIYRLATSPDRAFEDFCGHCWFANETEKRNSHLDTCGNCREVINGTDWNVPSVPIIDSQNVTCPCGSTPRLCADNVTTSCYDDCPEFSFCPSLNVFPDECGRCPGNSMYNKGKDSCDVCCDPDNGAPCDQDKDDCGVCFGFNVYKRNECKKCSNLPGFSCEPDCLGVYGGNATYGCDGVCNSDAVCSLCGNGIIDPGETCDLGTNEETGENLNVVGSGCSPQCRVEAGRNTGRLIGGIIGGIAAVAFLGLAAFFAVKYAQKAGLIGSANKQIDMGASNTNPLYKSEVAVHQNPLYEVS